MIHYNFVKIFSMKFYPTLNNHKTTIIFLPGFRKNHNDFNITEHGKKISIESTISILCNTILVNIDENDYKKSVPQLAEEIYQEIVNCHMLETKLIIVAHSLGSFCALYLCETYPNIFGKIFLIDPAIKSSTYHTQLIADAKDKLDDTVEYANLQNYKYLSDGLSLHNKIIVRIHININTKKMISDPALCLEEISYLETVNKITNKNTKSRLVVHANVSHMIHYKMPGAIIDAIRELVLA